MERTFFIDSVLLWLNDTFVVIEQFYTALSEEQQIWFWLGVGATVLITLAVTVAALKYSITSINKLLQSTSGWKPIRFYTVMWIGTSIWLVITALSLREEGMKGWTVVLAIGVVSAVVFFWFLASRIGILKMIGASATNSLLGVIVSPIVFYLGIFAIVIVVGLIAFSIWAACQPQRVYVVNR